MMTTLRIIDVDAYYESNTVKTLIRSTNLFPNLESITMRQPLDRHRSMGVRWVTLRQSCLGDDNVCVKTNPKLKRISMFPGVWATETELSILKEFVETNSSIEYMDVINHEDHEYRYRPRRHDNLERTGKITQCEGIVTSTVNTLAKNRALAIKKRTMEGGTIPSFMLEKVFSNDCYINVFDRKPTALLNTLQTPIRKADSMRPLFDIIKYFGPTRNFREKTDANVDEANVDEAIVLTEDAVPANAANFTSDADAENDSGK